MATDGGRRRDHSGRCGKIRPRAIIQMKATNHQWYFFNYLKRKQTIYLLFLIIKIINKLSARHIIVVVRFKINVNHSTRRLHRPQGVFVHDVSFKRGKGGESVQMTPRCGCYCCGIF